MVNTRRIASALQAGLALGVCLLGITSSASATSTSDKPAAILIWPKIVVDTAPIGDGKLPTDTVIEIANTDSSEQKQAHCFYINANGHCNAVSDQPGRPCQTNDDCPSTGTCVPGWNEIDFDIMITPDQPLAWRASQGMKHNDFPLTARGMCANSNRECDPRSSIQICDCVEVASNAGSGIPPSPEDPFVGSLKCIQFDPHQNPPAPDQSSSANKLIGSGLIEACSDASCTNGVDVERYNAVGLRFKNLATDHPGEIHLDNDAAGQYEACPATLILNHIFDGAVDPLGATTNTVSTDLTLVPCGDDFVGQEPGSAVAQFLVFNEFESRISTSRKVDCFFERPLSLIDTNAPSRSIFSYAVQGTLVGQTRIRGVGNAPTGHGLLGVARSNIGNAGVANNLWQVGNNAGVDIITIP
jgi:hypothetical protein